ncbi:MAG: hypothetical protein IPJ94_22935 [Chloroflexi bacterium]|nr:hypothetical protein [Chloroflexota bacterium]
MMLQVNRRLKMETRQRIGRLGWGVILGFSLLLFLLPDSYVPTALPPEVWLLMMIGALLLFWLGLFLGVGLLLVRYLPFFQQIKGPLLFLVLFMMGLRSFSYLQTFSDLGWPASQIFLVLAIWLFVLISVLPLVLGIYLWYQDRAARLLAITLLAIVWLLVAYTRWRGPEQIFQDTFQGALPAELFGLICFGQLVFVLAPLFFIGHSLRLLYREWTRVDML